MLILFLEWLQSLGVKVPFAFTYFSTRMILAAATALVLTIFLGPRFIKKLYELKIGQPIRSMEEVPLLAQLHGKKKDTPTMGGILILFSMAISLLLWMDLQSAFTWILAFTTLVLGLLGGIDDYLKLRHKNSKGLKSRKKMGIQVCFSALIALYLLVPSISHVLSGQKFCRPPIAKEQVVEGKKIITTTLSMQQYEQQFYIPFFKDPLFRFPIWLAFLFFIFVITGASNAVNLTDGLDGLAAGCLIMASLVLALFAFLSNHIDLARYLNILYIEGSGEIGVYLFAMAGAALGFLWYNGYPAQVFMGDTGSLSLGGILGVSAVCLRREVILAIAGGIFVAEALSVILQVLSYRYRHKKRVFLCAPLHHHFEYKGWPETKVVIRFWILSLLLAMCAVASLKLQ
ncbi:MAG: phospho-N-acetylmuramoyl-pentapeptide-transferase [Verrucomicrobia bacterium]|nr:phospho-N-acetylmuramoyl-pentapeptide-transferase [Verrucomicrobiota bacterium]MBU6445900.1 phospho-N-acetylmuramoyl-pentapeptide-transferase [Verrucomicrobiota bacterium]